ncbi:MAG: hypothetical protein LCH84_01715 [Gemmatimonadetes bacterium]|nr:hypothetical protein [Gemmatimonadota bacterium]
MSARAVTRAMRASVAVALAVAVSAVPLRAQRVDAPPPRQTEADAYTRYELLAPGSAKFRILYDVTATTAGARYYFNPIRAGSIATDERVTDRATGAPLAFAVVGAAEARAGGMRVSDSTQQYIRVTLARPVPADGGEARVLIDKTYEDARSYFTRGDTIVFDRPLGIKRNAVVLPPGYELVNCNYPVQVLREADGRLAVSFWNATPAEAPLVLRAVPSTALRAAVTPLRGPLASDARLDERARQTREITYWLQQPETHAFDLAHDYTESRAGVDHYVNVVRAGSRVSNPSALNLDTGEPLRHEVLRGEAIRRARLDVPTITAETEAVVFRFAPVSAGSSVRLRMRETYTDSARYRLEGDELVWDRGFGRPANAVVLPAGWVLTRSGMPAVVSTLPDGRVRLDFVNPRPDDLAVLVTARRR